MTNTKRKTKGDGMAEALITTALLILTGFGVIELSKVLPMNKTTLKAQIQWHQGTDTLNAFAKGAK